MKKLKIDFVSFWEHFDKFNNLFINILSERYEVEISNNPDLVFCLNDNLGTREYLNYKCHKFFVGMENERTKWNAFDYAIDSDYIGNKSRHLRFPLWALWDLSVITKPKNAEEIVQSKTKFCCMVISNRSARERIDFFHELSKYKQVDSGGKYLNNVGGPVTDKVEFIKDYKFVLSFENSSYPGYTTEKLIEPMYVNSIPVYWGNPKVHLDFNANSFVNVHDFGSYKEAIDHIILLDRDEELLTSKLKEPWFINNSIPVQCSRGKLTEFLFFVVEDMQHHKPVSQTYRKYFHFLDMKKRSLFHYLHHI